MRIPAKHQHILTYRHVKQQQLMIKHSILKPFKGTIFYNDGESNKLLDMLKFNLVPLSHSFTFKELFLHLLKIHHFIFMYLAQISNKWSIKQKDFFCFLRRIKHNKYYVIYLIETDTEGEWACISNILFYSPMKEKINIP